MGGGESHIYGDFIREINVSVAKTPKLKLKIHLFRTEEATKLRFLCRWVLLMVSSINQFVLKTRWTVFKPSSALDPQTFSRVCVCLVKLTPELLNRGSVVLWFCLTSLNKYTGWRVFLYVRDALSRES